MKALRIFLYVLSGVIVVALVAAIIVIRSFDLNDYKDEITAYVQERTGRILTIDENIEFSLFPWFAVETGGVSLSDDPDFADRSFVTVDSLSARVRVWPLLRRRIEIGRIVLDGINLNLGMDADGRGNWSTLLQTNSPQAPSLETPDPERQSFDEFVVEGIELRNTRMLWHDSDGEVIYIVRDLTLTTGPINDDDPVDVSVSLSALDVASQASAEIEVQSVAAIRPRTEFSDVEATLRLLDPREQERATATFVLNSLSLDGNLIRSGPVELTAKLRRPPFGPEELDIEADFGSIEIDTESEILVINGASARSGAIEANLNIRGDAVFSDPSLAGTVNVQSETVAALFESLGIEPPTDLNGEGIGGFAANAEFSLGLSSRALSVSRYAMTALGLEATGQAELGTDQTLIAAIDLPAFSPTEPLLGLIAPRLPEGVDLSQISSASLHATLALAVETSELAVDAFAIQLDDAEIDGRLSVDNIQSPVQIDGSLAAAGLDNRLLGALFSPWLPAELVETDLGEFRLVADFDYDTVSEIAVFAPLELTAYGLSGDGQLTVATANDTLTLSGRAAIAEFSPQDLLQRFDQPIPQTADPAVFRSAELAASFETNGANGEFRDIAIELDDSRITGEFSVENFADPAYRFVLRADRMDADRYLPPRAQPSGSGETASNDRRVGDIRLASEPLTNTVVSGTASVGNLIIGGMEFAQLAADVAFGNGRAALSSVQTQLYGGEFEGSLTIDATGESSEAHLTGNASEVEIQPLLEAILGSAYLSGTGTVALDLTGRGSTINEAMQTAAGSLNVELRDGEIEGVNLGYKLCEAVNSGRGLPAPANAPEVTAFSVIRGNATVSDGNASSSNLYAATGYLDLTGRGGIRLVDQWIDNQYRAAMTGPIPVAGCEDLNQTIANAPIPVNFTLTGRLPDIEVGIDISQLLQDWAQRELRNRAEEAVQEQLEDAIRGLFE